MYHGKTETSMKIKPIVNMMVVGLVLTQLLTACKSSETEAETPIPNNGTSATETYLPTSEVTEKVPLPTRTNTVETSPNDIYPWSEEDENSTPVGPVLSPTSQAGQQLPYPGAATWPPTVTPVTGGGYPGPESEITATPTSINNQYPAPETSFPTQTQGLSPTPSANVPTLPARNETPTPVPGLPSLTPAVAGSPTPFPALTPTLVRTNFVASNPAEFRLISGKPQLMVFFADWSPTSRSMAPVVNGLADRYSERIGFFFIDIDQPANSLFNSLINNRQVPIFILLDGQGNLLNEWQGFVEVENFEMEFKSVTP